MGDAPSTPISILCPWSRCPALPAEPGSLTLPVATGNSPWWRIVPGGQENVSVGQTRLPPRMSFSNRCYRNV